MIQKETQLFVADNTGAKIAQCIHVYKKKTARMGDIILISVKTTKKKSKMKKPIIAGTIYKALVIRTKYASKNGMNSYVSFDNNSLILLNNQLQPVGTRIFGPVPLKLRQHKHFKIISLASNLV
jgi:large subunit ribosomal protein L14